MIDFPLKRESKTNMINFALKKKVKTKYEHMFDTMYVSTIHPHHKKCIENVNQKCVVQFHLKTI